MPRQGDILLGEMSLVEVKGIPKGVRLVARTPKEIHQTAHNDGRIVLAYGEATGHAHAVVGEAELYTYGETADAAERFLRIGAGGATLVHEEHGTITLRPNSLYQVYRQYEYEPGSLRRVED